MTNRCAIVQYGSDDVTLKVRETADLTTTNTDSKDSVAVGEPFTYTITVHNPSPNAATGVKTTDVIKAPLELDSVTTSQGSCTTGGMPTKVTCNLGSLPAGGTATITIHVHATATGQAKNTATTTANQLDPDPPTTRTHRRPQSSDASAFCSIGTGLPAGRQLPRPARGDGTTDSSIPVEAVGL